MLLPQDGEYMCSDKVISPEKDDMVNLIGVSNYNPILDTCVYNVMFLYEYLKPYAANVITKYI